VDHEITTRNSTPVLAIRFGGGWILNKFSALDYRAAYTSAVSILTAKEQLR
jgi:hypothetical protein